MGFFDIFKRKAQAAPAGPADALALFPPWATPPRRGTVQLLRQYREAPWLRAVVHKVGVSVSQVNWRLYRRNSAKAGVGIGLEKAMRDARLKALVRSRQLTEVEDHPLLNLLARPNQQMTGPAMLQLLQAHYDLKGEAFATINRTEAGVVNGLFPVPPSWVQSLPTKDSRAFRVTPLTGRGVTEIPEEDMLFLRDLDPENPYSRGTGIAESLGDELETDEYAARWVKGWFYNGGMPGMLVGVDSGAGGAGSGPSNDEIKKMKEAWLSEHQGPSNSNKPMFMRGKLTTTRLDTSFKDTSVVEMRIMLRDFVRQVYGVPPEVLGITENSNRATANTAYFLFAQNVVLPRLEIWRAHFQAHLVPFFGEDLVLDFDSPVPADRDQQLNVMGRFPFAFSLAEFRELAGAEPREGFDKVFPPMAMPGQDSASAVDLAAGKEPAPAADQQSEDAAGGGVDETQPSAAPTETPQNALNGAQVQAAQQIVVAVANGQLPRETGLNMLVELFGLDPAAAERIMGTVGAGFEPRPEGGTQVPPAKPPEPA